jgi:hypothetical protein
VWRSRRRSRKLGEVLLSRKSSALYAMYEWINRERFLNAERYCNILSQHIYNIQEVERARASIGARKMSASVIPNIDRP